MAGVSKCNRKARLSQIRDGLEVREDFWETEVAPKAAVPNEKKSSIPFGRECEFEIHLIRPWM